MSVALSLNAPTCSWDDDEPAGRIRTAEEFVAAFRARTDIFAFHRERHAQVTEIASVAAAIGLGVWLSSMKQPVEVGPDYMQQGSMPSTGSGSVRVLPAVPRQPEPTRTVKPAPSTTQRAMQASRHPGRPGHSSGGGSRHARITQRGVIGLMSAAVQGSSTGLDPLGLGGFSDKIDVILAGKGGLRQGGDGGTGRRGFASIGVNTGYGPGFGGGEGGDGLDGLLDGGEESVALEVRPRTHRLDARILDPVVSGGITGGRSKSSIQRVVMQYMQALRYAYTKRLRENPSLKGTITVKFGIDEFGDVLGCTVVRSTMDDDQLAQTVAHIVSLWRFGKIDKPNDVTEVVYPFVFTM